MNKYKRDGIIELGKSAYTLGKHTIVSNLPKSLRRKYNPIKSREELHEYWESRSDSEDLPFDEGNLPENYLDPSERSEFLVDIMSKYTEKSDAILELGCNVGRNLNFLYKNGYRNLHSIENKC